MSKRSMGVMAIAMLLIVGLIAPVSAESHDAPSDPLYYTGQGMPLDENIKCGGDEDLGLDEGFTVAEDGSYLKWVFTGGSADSATLHGPWGSYEMIGNGGVFMKATDYDELSELDGVYVEWEGDAGTNPQLVVSNGCPGVPVVTQTVVYNKNWIGDTFDGSSLVVTFDVNIDGTVGTFGDGEVIYYEDDYLFVGENVSGFPEDVCSWEFDSEEASSSTTMEGDTAASFIITNAVACDDTPTPDTVTINKIWEGDLGTNPEIAVSFSYDLVDGFDVGSSGILPAGETLTLPDAGLIVFTGEIFDPALPEGCTYEESYELVGALGDVREHTDSVGFNEMVFNVTNDVTCEGPVVGRLPDTVTVLKEWTGDFDGEGVVATFSYLLDSPAGSMNFTEEGTFTEGDAPIQLEVDQSIRFTGETLSVALPEGCTYEETYELEGAIGDTREHTDVGGFTARTFVVTNDVTCIGTDVLPVIIERKPAPEREVVEVLGVTVTRAVPTGIDTGTGGYLPSSTPPAALLLLLLFGGLVLTGGAAASLVRRRG